MPAWLIWAARFRGVVCLSFGWLCVWILLFILVPFVKVIQRPCDSSHRHSVRLDCSRFMSYYKHPVTDLFCFMFFPPNRGFRLIEGFYKTREAVQLALTSIFGDVCPRVIVNNSHYGTRQQASPSILTPGFASSRFSVRWVKPGRLPKQSAFVILSHGNFIPSLVIIIFVGRVLKIFFF